MAKVTVTIDTPAGVDPFETAADSKRTKLRALASLLQSLASLTFRGHPTLRAGTAQASGTVTCVSAAATDVVSINGVDFTAVASGATGNQFNVGGNDAADAASLASAINNSASALVSQHVTATSASNVVTVRAKTKGTPGNAITLTSSNDTRLDVTGTRLTGGTDTVYSF